MITTKLNNMRIAITGIGIISALGLGKEANKANLLAGRSGICAPRILQTIHKEWPVGEVGMTNEQLKQQCRQKADSPCPRNVLLAYAAASEAVADAHLTPEQVEELILVNGTTVGGITPKTLTASFFMRPVLRVFCLVTCLAEQPDRPPSQRLVLQPLTLSCTAPICCA